MKFNLEGKWFVLIKFYELDRVVVNVVNEAELKLLDRVIHYHFTVSTRPFLDFFEGFDLYVVSFRSREKALSFAQAMDEA